MRDLPEGSNTNTLMQQELEKLGNEKCRENEKKRSFFSCDTANPEAKSTSREGTKHEGKIGNKPGNGIKRFFREATLKYLLREHPRKSFHFYFYFIISMLSSAPQWHN